MTAFSSSFGRMTGRRKRSNRERFLEKVCILDNGCWDWLGWKDKDGYGMFNFRYPDGSLKDIRATHAAHMLETRETSVIGQANHTCDNPSCVNLKHIFFGTQQDNMDDMVAKGRSDKGESRFNAVLTETLVIDIRRRRSQGESIASIARSTGFNPSTVGAAANSQNWKHITACISGQSPF